MTTGADPTVHVLVVCTGNICRSPAAERLLAVGLGGGFRGGSPAGGIVVASAGTRAVVGAPMSPPMADLVARHGLPPDAFTARLLTAEQVRGSDVVIAMTREHRAAAVSLAPAAVRRAFTLRELARLAGSVDPAALPDAPASQRLRALVPLAAAQRGMVAAAPEDDDVHDPIGGTDALYARVFAQMVAAVDAIVAVVGRRP